MSTQAAEFKKIDNALELYYLNNGYSNYRDDDGIGLFMQYILDEQLDDPELPIEDELGDDCTPTDCSYAWMNNNSNSSFPIPDHIVIPSQDIEPYIFYILQHCYKYSEPPTVQYIIANILPKVHGTIKNNTPSAPKINKTSKNQHEYKSTTEIPPAFAETDTYEIKEEYNTFDAETHEGGQNEGTFTIQRVYKTEFKPKYSARAHLNIFTSKELITSLLDRIEEPFDDELRLYYYTDLSAALQMNDHQVQEFKVLINNEEHKFGIINYDFHVKGTEEILYGIFVPNDDSKVQQDKWLWKLDEFLTGREILNKYDVASSELPRSSRKMDTFQEQLKHKLVIDEKLMHDTDWFGMKQIKSLKRNTNIPKVTVTFTKAMWIEECTKSFMDSNSPLIPVVVNKNNKHWIEWVKIVYVKSQDIYVGVSCKYYPFNDEWKIESICLDRGDIYNKHRLVGLIDNKYVEQLKGFKTSLTEIIFSDNSANDIDKKMNVLKQQIASQQNSIVRLKESLIRVKNKNKFDNMGNIPPDPSIHEQIEDLINDDDDKCMDDEDPLSQIVDDVIKKYDVLPFKTNPVGAKRNIYIDTQFTKSWINYVFPRFPDASTMYYWLDYTTAIQMIQNGAKKYVDKANNAFIVAIINCELKDNYNNNLYGIICADNNKNKENDQYPYKLTAFMTKEQVRNEFGINHYDLPKKSRKNQQFLSKLLLKRKISKQDLNQIRWGNLKLFKPQSNINDNSIQNKPSVTITKAVMKEYINIDLERLNDKNHNENGNNLIPILVVDKHNNYYGIDWVLIVNIVHRHCNVGVSFRFNETKNLFIATAIYLDKIEIESKHRLIGLKHNYLQNVKAFSLKKLKIKSNTTAVLDADDCTAADNNNNDIYNHNTTVSQYQQMIHSERIKNHQLQQQILNQQQLYMQEIESLKQQNQHYAMSMSMQPQQHAIYHQPQYNNNNNINNINNTNMDQYYCQY